MLELSCTIAEEEWRSQLLDAVICFVFREVSQMVNPEDLPQVSIPHTKVEAFGQALNAPVTQGPGYLLRFHQKASELPVNQKRLREIDLLLPPFLKMLGKKKEEYGPFSFQVREMLLNMSQPELPNFEELAHQFPHSHRTIQRKLRDEGLTFRKIVDEIKQELWSHLEMGHSIKSKDIAYILGYSETSAYLHAVKRWKQNASISLS
ncbi:hypothetical protein KFE98_08215 [bacterium SCSIO 12741]|nr:hypothetical protein KFE98_08215 [bacterium SCSIO 12741]